MTTSVTFIVQMRNDDDVNAVWLDVSHNETHEAARVSLDDMQSEDEYQRCINTAKPPSRRKPLITWEYQIAKRTTTVVDELVELAVASC